MKSSTIFTWIHVLLMGIVFLTFLIGEIEGGIKAGGKFDFKQRKNNQSQNQHPFQGDIDWVKNLVKIVDSSRMTLK